MGQIDLARIVKEKGAWMIELGEVKSSCVGEEQWFRRQKSRLQKSQIFLSALLGHSGRIFSIKGKFFAKTSNIHYS
jgi:hypothetical protein